MPDPRCDRCDRPLTHDESLLAWICTTPGCDRAWTDVARRPSSPPTEDTPTLFDTPTLETPRDDDVERDVATIHPDPPRVAREDAHARSSDPQTSRDAAINASHDLGMKQGAVLACLHRNGPMTDERLIDRYAAMVGHPMTWHGTTTVVPRQSDSGIRTRRAELVRRSKVKASGKTRVSSGGLATVWKAIDATDRAVVR